MNKEFIVIQNATPSMPEEKNITKEVLFVYDKNKGGFIVLNNKNEDITDLVRIEEIICFWRNWQELPLS